MKTLQSVLQYPLKSRLYGLAALVFLYLPIAAHAQVKLADQPLTTSATVPGNLMLALSVEYPTAISSSYKGTNDYASASTFLGYFDPNKCYQYKYDAGTPNNSYFEPNTISTTHVCTSTATLPVWSGNWLNWAAMQTIDTFRYGLTGGYRVKEYDLPDKTILEKSYASNQGGIYNAPDKTLGTSTLVTGATPFNFSSLTSSTWSRGNRMRVSGSASNINGTKIDYNSQNSYVKGKKANLPSTSDVYELVMRVQVCEPSPGVEGNCVQYGANYKPEGLLQKYASKIRFGAFGYLNDPAGDTNNINRDGGVLRAPIKFIGPIKPVPGQLDTTNSATEWSSTDGTYLINPDPADASATGVANSGVLNYLNKFGQDSMVYKTFDPISEMYYATLRYYRNLGNVPAYSNLGSDTTKAALYKDNFPIVTNWVDPILYSCQKNFILGIGDVNTHRDANLPGSTIRSNEPSMPSEVSSDTTVDVLKSTNMVGTLEGLSNLGTTNPYWCCNQNTYFMAGLAYDAHTNDIRPKNFGPVSPAYDSSGNITNKTLIQTVSTFWLDVLENGAYQKQNQFYLATKYGGFRVPTGFKPYAATNATNTLTVASGTTPLTDAMWHANSDINTAYAGVFDKRPDNYFDASAADKMIIGLQSAFSDIASQLSESTTAFSYTSPRLPSSGNAGYQSKYDASDWSGDVIGSTSSFDANGKPTLTPVWHANTILNSTPPAQRKIVTCCKTTGTPGNVGLPFQDSDLLGGVISRTNYASFANVAGVPVASQSAVNFLNYLRGDRSLETAQSNGVYRTRSFLLGDIVNSKITGIGPPQPIFNESSNAGYASFTSTYATRKIVAYVGANDGMMHAFNGSVSGSGGGSELFSYIPSFVYGNVSTGPVSGLASLGTPYFIHHNLVDGTPSVYDIDLAKTSGSTSTTPKWRTVLIGGLGKGGKGYYAIDITDPTSWTSEAAVASKVLWEFTDPDMGYSYGEPAVFKTTKYGWVVVFTSGYNNLDGKGYFFIVNPANGALLEKISTGFGTATAQSGMVNATGHIPNSGDFTADAIYSGDLAGNIWRLDLTPATGSYAAPLKIARLTDAAGNVQAVTSRILVESQPSTLKRYVLVGTGRLLDNSDIANNQVQSFYAISDGTVDTFYTSATLPSGKTFPIQRADLAANTNLLTGIGSAPSSTMGWYYDLNLPTNGVSERINVNPDFSSGIVAFAANLPNGDACSPTGTNRIFAVNLGTGQSILTSPTGTATAFSTKLSGFITDLSFVSVNGKTTIIAGDSSRNVDKVDGIIGEPVLPKRLNWRELPTAD
jgi:type IV pilus assembly protein PilY1